jgi:hypothetical protein
MDAEKNLAVRFLNSAQKPHRPFPLNHGKMHTFPDKETAHGKTIAPVMGFWVYFFFLSTTRLELQ